MCSVRAQRQHFMMRSYVVSDMRIMDYNGFPGVRCQKRCLAGGMPASVCRPGFLNSQLSLMAFPFLFLGWTLLVKLCGLIDVHRFTAR